MECRECNLRFQNVEDFANHKERFCVGTEYHDPKRLAESVARDGVESDKQMSLDEVKRYLNGEGFLDAGSMTLGRLRQDASQDEGQMDSLRHMMQRQREKEKADELRALTMRQNRLKQDRQQDTDQVLKLMKELQEQKRRELTARMEREQVKKALQGIEEGSLQELRQEKQREMEELQRKRASLADEERELSTEVERLTADLRQKEESLAAERRRKREQTEATLRGENGEGKRPSQQDTLRAAASRHIDRASQLKTERAQLERQRAEERRQLDQRRRDLGLERHQPDSPSDDGDAVSSLVEEISSSLHEEKRRLQSLRERAAKEKEETEAFVYSADDTVASIMGKQVPSSAAVAEEAESYLASLSKKDPGLKATRRSVRLWDTDRGQPRTPAPSKAQAGAGRPPPSTSGARRTRTLAGAGAASALGDSYRRPPLGSRRPGSRSGAGSGAELSPSSPERLSRSPSPVYDADAGSDAESRGTDAPVAPSSSPAAPAGAARGRRTAATAPAVTPAPTASAVPAAPATPAVVAASAPQRAQGGVPATGPTTSPVMPPAPAPPGSMGAPAPPGYGYPPHSTWGGPPGAYGATAAPPYAPYPPAPQTMVPGLSAPFDPYASGPYAAQMAAAAEAQRRREAEEAAAARRREEEAMEREKQEFEASMQRLQQNMMMAMGGGMGMGQPWGGGAGAAGAAQGGGQGEGGGGDDAAIPSWLLRQQAALRALGALPKDSELYKRQLRHLTKMAEMHMETEEAEQAAKKSEAVRKAQEREEEAERQRKQAEWLEEQKREVIRRRIGIQLARESAGVTAQAAAVTAGGATGAGGAPYNAEEGARVLFDFVTPLPQRASNLNVAYSVLYHDGSARNPTKPKNPTPCPPSGRIHILGYTNFGRTFRESRMRGNRWMFEVTINDKLPDAAPEGVGWCEMDMFHPEEEDSDGGPKLCVGRWRLPLMQPPAEPGSYASSVAPNRLSHFKTELFLRVVHARDAETAASESNDPDSLQHLYHIPPWIQRRIQPEQAPAPAAPATARVPTPQPRPSPTPAPAPAPAAPAKPPAKAAQRPPRAPSGSGIRSGSRAGGLSRPPSALPPPNVSPLVGSLSEADADEEVDEEEDEEVLSQADAPRTLRVGIALNAVNLPEDCDPTSSLHILLDPGPGRAGGAQSEAWVVQLPLEAADEDGTGPTRVLSVALPESVGTGQAIEAGRVLAHVAMSVRGAGEDEDATPTYGLAYPIVGDGRDGMGRIRVRTAAGLRRPLARGPPQPPAAPSPQLEEAASIGSRASDARRSVSTPATGRGSGSGSGVLAHSGFVEFDVFDPVSGSVAGSAPPTQRERGSELPSRPPTTTGSDVDGDDDLRGAWIHAKTEPTQAVEYRAEDGFDVVVDGARFLPETVTLSRVTIKAIDRGFKPQGSSADQVAGLDEVAHSPYYGAQVAYSGDFNPTSTLVFRVDAFESGSRAIRVCGYALLNAFYVPGRDSTEQPSTEGPQRLLLRSGAFQLPLRQMSPSPKGGRALTATSLDNVPRVPCSTLLLRVVPRNPGHVSAVGPTPPYASGAYDSTQAVPLRSERLMYRFMADRSTARVRDVVMLAAAEGEEDMVPAASADGELKEWIEAKFHDARPSRFLDYLHSVRYQPEAGFRAAVVGVHRQPKGEYTVAISCLSPPAPYFQEPRLTDDVAFTPAVDWDSPQSSPRFPARYETYTGEALNESLMLVVQVLSVKLDKRGSAKLTPVGWAVLPVFDEDGFVRTGAWQVPALKGSPTQELLRLMEQRPPYEVIEEEAARGRRGRVHYAEPMSVFINLIDEQIADCARLPGTWDTRFLPAAAHAKYAYDADKVGRDRNTLRKIVRPRGTPVEEFQAKMNEAISAATDIAPPEQQQRR